MLRRLEKRILVDLPVPSARRAMIAHHLPPVISTRPISITSSIDYDRVAEVSSRIQPMFVVSPLMYACVCVCVARLLKSAYDMRYE